MQITTLLQPGETLHYVTDGELDHHLPKPPARLLPERRSGPSSRSSVLVVVVLLAINAFETVLDLLLEAAKWPFRRLGRLFHGRCMDGGWTSDAGRFALEVYGAHWTHNHHPFGDLWLAVTADRLLVAIPEQRHLSDVTVTVATEPSRDDVAVRDASLRPRRRRLDLLFRDGSWVALKLPSAAAARSLAAALDEQTVNRRTPPAR